MKKITLLLLLFIAFEGNSQVIASQNFDLSLGWTSSVTGWARRATGGAPACSPYAGSGMARYNSYDLAAGSSARLTSPAITFTGANYRVKFKMFRDSGYPTDADNVKVYINTTATAGGTLLGTVNRSKALAPVETDIDGWYSYSFDIPGTLSGVRYVYFLGTGAYGNNIFIDEATVEQIPSLDAELKSFSMNPIITSGTTPISGVIVNSGLTTITSAQVKWQVDSGLTSTQTLNGLNLAPGQSYNFTHSNQWTATPGSYSVKVWVANINGLGADNDATNDQIIKSVSVASNSTARLPLYEKFSSSTCGPCASFNGSYFNPFYTANHTNFALIDYQVNWPGAGDPYYTAEVGTRVSYYGVNGAPTLFVDSKEGTNFDSGLLLADLNDAIANPSFFALSATKSLVGNDMTIQVTTNPYLTGTYKLYVAVVEKITTGNIATNGETSFKNVMMKMLPDANGTSINFTNDVVANNTLQATLTGLHIEEMSDLDVIVFIQNPATKAIMQSAFATEALSKASFDNASKIKLYPNPSTGIVKVNTENTVSVIVTDIMGKVVYSFDNVTKDTPLNLSSLQKGIYLAKIIDGGSEQTQKIILK